MLKRIEELIISKQDFSFETTLSSKLFLDTIDKAKSSGYYVTLIFFWLETVELAKDRVKKRVLEGGHNIEPTVIERRYFRGIKNLFRFYSDKVDSLLIFDNSTPYSELIAEKEIDNKSFTIYNSHTFNSLKMISHE